MRVSSPAAAASGPGPTATSNERTPCSERRSEISRNVVGLMVLKSMYVADAGIVVMGAVSRGRLDRWFVGNTAEAVLDRLPSSVWVEKLPQA